jgi:hypothetical protein
VEVRREGDGRFVVEGELDLSNVEQIGDALWAKQYRSPGGFAVYANAVATDGLRVFVTGDGQRPDGQFDYLTVSYDAATGALLWVKRYRGVLNSD